MVRINLPLLLDENQRALDLTGATLQINLFPDLIYTGVIEQFDDSGASVIWNGYLQDVAYSGMTMVFTDGVFIAKFASPEGVYEVSNIGGDLYRVILIDQEKLQGGENAVEVHPTNP